jgi:hypothetical protein
MRLTAHGDADRIARKAASSTAMGFRQAPRDWEKSSMNWPEHISRSVLGAKFGPAAPSADIQRSESRLGVAFHASLRELLEQTDGVIDRSGTPLIWTTRDIAEKNLVFRANNEFPELYMPFDNWLFFGDAGDGDQFVFAIVAGEIPRADVFIWDHETDNRSWFAPTLEALFAKLAGEKTT